MARLKHPLLILIAAPTGAGKSTLLEFIKQECKSSVHVGTKYTTRPKRVTDSEYEFHFVNEIPSQLIQYSYSSVGWHYAFDIEEIKSTISLGLSYITVCTDPIVIQKLASIFNTVVIYLYRHLSTDEFLSLMKLRHTLEEIKVRQGEVESALNSYIRNIELYDFVVLNSGTLELLIDQIKAILEICGVLDKVSLPSLNNELSQDNSHSITKNGNKN